MVVTREIVVRNGEPVWLVCSGGLCIEAKSGIQAKIMIEALEASAGTLGGVHGPIGQPRRGPDMVPDPGV